MQYYDVIIIGGGPAGLFAAAHIPGSCKAVVIEKGARPGRKLLLSGSGQCNLTHAGEIKDFLAHYGQRHRFLKHALFTFTNEHLLQYFTNRGIWFICDEKGKFFPNSLKAGEILEALMNETKTKNIHIRCNTAVKSIQKTEEGFILETEDVSHNEIVRWSAKNVIIATGGKSYPQTGSTGDGQALAMMLGHTIVPMKPALASVLIKNHKLQDFSGNSFEQIGISLIRKNTKIIEAAGDMVITHQGLSGPAILDNSRYMEKGDVIQIHFCNMKEEDFLASLREEISLEGKAMIKTCMRSIHLPKNLRERLVLLAGVYPEMHIAEISKKQQQELAKMFCSFPAEIASVCGFESAMCTTGGVSLKEINPKTMESKIVSGVFFAGEVMDVDGDSGGYNLQAAFSTGFIAGISVHS